MLAVACISEAIELRRSGVTAPILCLGETPEECYPLLLEHRITQMVEDLETGEKLSAAAQTGGGDPDHPCEAGHGHEPPGLLLGGGPGGRDGR